MNRKLNLYGTSACHLCESAQAIVQPLALARGLELCLIDIAGDDALEARYSLTIPVLSGIEGELCWPFSTDEVIEFLDQHQK